MSPNPRKIAVVADVHLGNHARWGGPVVCGVNGRCRSTLGVLAAAYRRAWELECLYFVVAGDLLDTDRPPAQLLAEVQTMAGPRDEHAGSECGPIWVVVSGNHDVTSSARGDHALGPLAPAGIEVVDHPQLFGYARGQLTLALVPHQPGRAVDWLPAEVAKLRELARGSADAVSALVVHVGVVTDATPPFLLDAPDAVPAALLAELARSLGARVVFAGNWHDRQVRWVTSAGEVLREEPAPAAGAPVDDGTVTVFQLGALVPTGFDNPGLDGYGTLAVMSSDALEPLVRFEELPGPRFVKAADRADAARVVAAARTGGHELYLSCEARLVDMASARAYVAELRALGHVAEAEAVPSRAEAQESGHAAAEGARSATTLDEALASYVAKAAFAGSPDRGVVLERCKAYLAGVHRERAVSIRVHSIEHGGLFDPGIEPCDMVLPDAGLVLIQGTNSSGKSSRMSAVSVALWDETDRGTPAWCGSEGSASVEVTAGSQRLTVRRWGTSGCAGLQFDDVKYGTPTKAQAVLRGVVGSHAQWRATSVFDANADTNARFGRLTDGGRKKFLEELIGLDFDGPIKRCRNAKREADLAAARAEARVEDAERSVRRALARVSEAELAYGVRREAPPAVEDARGKVAAALTAQDALRVELGDLRGTAGRQNAELHYAAEARKLAAQSQCPTCARPIDEPMKRGLLAAATLRHAAATTSLASANERIAACEVELRQLEGVLLELRDALAGEIEATEEKRRQGVVLDDADEALAQAELDLAAAREVCAAAQAELEVLQAAEQVLGLRGVRAVMVGQVLGAIEQASNAWLARFHFPGTVRFEVDDEGQILLMIDGAGRGYGYKALSRGMQARVNLAFVRAFAGLNGDEGTLFFDEPFDGLDEEGRADAVKLVEELAAHRCVVLISHDARLVQMLRPVARYEVQK